MLSLDTLWKGTAVPEMKEALGLPDPEGHSLGGLQCGEAPATGREPEPGRRDSHRWATQYKTTLLGL